MSDPTLPPGFELDEEAPPLPPGFQVDSNEPPTVPQGMRAPKTGEIPGRGPGGAIGIPVPQAPPTFMDKIHGAVAAGSEIAASIIGFPVALAGGALGAAGGAIGGVAGAASQGELRTQKGARGILDAATEGAEKGFDTVMGITQQRNGQPLAPQAEELRKEHVESAGKVMGEVAPMIGLGGEISLIGRSAAARSAGQAIASEIPLIASEAKTAVPAAAERLFIGREQSARNAAVRQGADAMAMQEAAKTAALEAPQRAGIQAARDAGFVLTPNAAKAGGVAKTVESLSGSPRLEKLASEKNAQVANKLIREDVGLGENVPLSRNSLGSVIKEEGQHYDALKQVGEVKNDTQYMADIDKVLEPLEKASKSFPLSSPQRRLMKELQALKKDSVDAEAVINKVKLLREDADKAYRTGDKTLGKAYKSAAQAMDDSLDRYLGTIDDPVLAEAVPRYREARQRIAKAYMAQSALNDATGNINAAAYAKALKKGQKLTGNAELVGKVAQQFEKLVQNPDKVGATGATYADLLAAIVSKEALAMGARPAARHALLSEAVQNRMVPKSPPKAGEPPAPELTAEQAPFPAQGGGEPPTGPLGDLTPDWDTAPGAAPAKAAVEVAPAEGLVPSVDELPPPARVVRQGDEARVDRNAGQGIPAVPGRPGQADTMLVGPPKEAAVTDADNAAMQTPGAKEAIRRVQQGEVDAKATAEAAEPVPVGELVEGGPADAAAAVERAEPVPTGEATEVTPSDPRLKEIEQLRAGAQSDAVKKVLDGESARIKKDLKRKTDAEELRRAAVNAKTPELREALLKHATELEKTEKLPVPEVKEGQPEIKVQKEKIPVGKVVEGEPKRKADMSFPSIDDTLLREQARDREVSQRGVEAVRKTLEDGAKSGAIDKDAADLALWALAKNPKIANNLRVRISEGEGGVRGDYEPAVETVRLFKEHKDPLTAAHEILHHAERMMPSEVQQGIRKEWRRSLSVEIERSKSPQKEALLNVQKAMGGDKEAAVKVRQAFNDKVLTRDEHYQLTDPSEFWAVNAADILSERFTSRNSWRGRAIQWLKDLGQKVQGSLGLRSNAPILRALEDVLTGTGERKTANMLDAAEREGSETWTGTFKKGMTASGAKDAVVSQTKNRPDLEWGIVPAPELGKDRFKLEGKRRK